MSKDSSSSTTKTTRAKGSASPRTRQRETKKTTAQTIPAAAESVFAKFGYDGSSVERISKQAKCYESLIYYHYGSKDKLFAAVLENAYRKLIQAEEQLNVDLSDPRGALITVTRFMWGYYQQHPELILLLNTENLLKGKHLGKASSTSQFYPTAITLLRQIVEKGIESGVFRPGIDIDHLYITVMGLGYFYVSNRYTLSAFFDKNLMSAEEQEKWSHSIVATVLSVVEAR